MAKHVRRRARRQRDPFDSDQSGDFEAFAAAQLPSGNDGTDVEDEDASPTDWFGPEEADELEGYVARRDVPLAAMLMVAAQPWQRIDGMGLARKALEAEVTGDARRDLSDDERFMLANGRAWCLLVHADLAHGGRRDDPIVLADARRHLEVAQLTDPTNPSALTTLALLWIRQGDPEAARQAARHAVDEFASMPDGRRSGQIQASAILALVTLGLAYAAGGDLEVATTLSTASRAARSPLDIDEAAFAALTGEIAELS